MREGPTLAGQILQVAHLHTHFFLHLTAHAVLDRLTGFDKTGQGAVDPTGKARRAGQQDLITTGHQHDHARRQTRVMLQGAGWAMHRPLTGNVLHGRPAAAAKAVLARPGADLAGIAEHLEGVTVAVQHELAQSLPGTALDDNRLLQL